MKEITAFKFSYTPWKKGPLRQVDVYIVAENRKEAELLALRESHKFFDQDLNVSVKEELHGYME